MKGGEIEDVVETSKERSGLCSAAVQMVLEENVVEKVINTEGADAQSGKGEEIADSTGGNKRRHQ